MGNQTLAKPLNHKKRVPSEPNPKRRSHGWRLLWAAFAFAIALTLVWWSARGMDPKQLLENLQRISLRWLYLAIGCSLMAFYVRALRWKLLLEAKAQRVPTGALFWTLMASYMVNYAIPRIGEVYRCGVLKRVHHLSASRVLGTVLLERTVDMICLACASLSALWLAPNITKSLWHKVWHALPAKQLLWVAILLALAVGVAWRLRKRLHLPAFKGALEKVKEGFVSLKHTPHPLQFALYTLLMWVLYFLNTYCIFYCLPESSTAGAQAAWVVMVAGGIGMTAPVQGGIGTFHILVSMTLLSYGLSKGIATTLTSVIYGSYALITILLGGIGFFYITMLSRQSPCAPHPKS